MIALLVVLTFVTAVLIDHLVNRKPIPIEDPRAMNVAAPRLTPAVVAGFKVPDNLLYHIGHTWALAESPQLVRIGLDDLAAKVAGPIDAIDVPERGQWIRQGQKIIAMHRDGHDLELLSPIEGAVVNINEKVLRNPELARTDPYGEGWLLTVNSPEANTNFRNLLRGTMARRWMEDSAQKLRGAGALAQDGGVALDALVDPKDFARICEEVFLT
jgi:glycine cleavage system H lipoate-binding protein